MATKLRKTGLSIVGDLPWGMHLCLFHETKEDLLDTLVPYFKTGLESNEFCVWAVSEPLTQDEARLALSQGIPAFDQYLAAGSIEILRGHEWYLKDGRGEPKSITAGWHEASRRIGARPRGNEGQRKRVLAEYEPLEGVSRIRTGGQRVFCGLAHDRVVHLSARREPAYRHFGRGARTRAYSSEAKRPLGVHRRRRSTDENPFAHTARAGGPDMGGARQVCLGDRRNSPYHQENRRRARPDRRSKARRSEQDSGRRHRPPPPHY
jgi:MEDS: MEthanogen/methylotroph, DcmR Sensory domain